MKKYLSALLVPLIALSQISTIFVPVAVQAQTASLPSGFCYTFTRNMGVGSAGIDVQNLTYILATQGYLSNGSTDTYTESVAAAVVGFQEKYAAQILTPNGLSYGTGFVGASTRAQLNSFYGCSTSTTHPTQSFQCPTGYTCAPQNQTPTPTFTCPAGYTCAPSSTGSSGAAAPTLSQIDPSSGTPGSWVKIYGSGFLSASSVVVFSGSGQSHNISPNSLTSTAIGIYVPSDLALGTYSVTVENIGGGWTSSSLNSLSFTVATTAPNTSTCPAGYSCIPEYGGLGLPPTTTSPVTTCPTGYVCNYSPGTTQSGSCPANYICNTAAPSTLTPPTVSYISPTSGSAGSSITVTGSGFSNGSSVVDFDGSGSNTGSWHISPNSLSANSLTFTVPSSAPAGNYVVVVTGNSGGWSTNNTSYALFTVTSPTCPAGYTCGQSASTPKSTSQKTTDDFNITNDLNTMRTAAEVYFSGNNYSYSGLCSTSNNGISLVMNDMVSRNIGGQSGLACNVNSSAYSLSSSLNNGGYACVDSTGANYNNLATLPTGTSCK